MKEPKPSLRVLMVDDDEDDFILIRDLLMDNEDIDFAVDWISNVEEAVGAIGSGDHDICLLDYRLGLRNGLEVLEQVDVHNRSMPIILLTGHGKYDVDIRAMKAGVDDYLVKDQINASLLERSIRYAIDRRRSKRDLEAAYSEMEQRVIARTSELAKANHNLKKSSEKIKRFAYSVSHDLKGPAIAIHG
ncbi:MAG: response regulator, partial [Thermodesulfobacteriota bacterium]